MVKRGRKHLEGWPPAGMCGVSLGDWVSLANLKIVMKENMEN